MIRDVLTLKNGLFEENGELIYYEDGVPKHAGVVRIDKDIYYISSGGKAIKGEYIVHREMSNGILKRGTYTFGDDYKLVPGSYIAPKKKRRKNKLIKNKKNSAKISFRERLKEVKHKSRIVIALAVAVLLLGGAWLVESDVFSGLTVQKPSQSATFNSKVTLPEFTEDVLLCTKAAKMEYDGTLALTTAIKAGNPYVPFSFEYSLVNCSGTLFLGEKEDLSDARQYDLHEKEQAVTIDNLKVDTTYYYMVVADKQEFFGSFHTAPSTRFVNIPGLVNTRDIGGGVTLDGKTVKQGLLIRGVELDGLVNASYFIPMDEVENVRESFGFVYDMDLRSADIYNGEYTSRLEIPHKFYAAPQYGEIFNETRQESIKKIFSDLADPEKYPMYLHCTWGQDRTGTIIFLLQGILNMSEADMEREYRLTGYTSPIIAENNKIQVITSGLEPYAGDTVQEKIYTFLTTEIGVTEEEIASIRAIFLEE